MKGGINIFCSSQAATAICLSMEPQAASSSSSILFSSSPAIDRYNPIIRDSRRIAKPIPPCSTPHPPISPKPHKKKNKKAPLKQQTGDQAKRDYSSSFIIKPDDDDKISISSLKKNDVNASTTGSIVRKSWSCTRPGAFISPPGSTRYLLSDKVFFKSWSDLDQDQKLFHAENSKSEAVKANESSDAKLRPSSGSTDQVVVLRVSLHCRGCERKMRKHISRMEGVTSFNIDFAAKKVTVTGNITPLEVLASISKVKNAQILSPPISPFAIPTNGQS